MCASRARMHLARARVHLARAVVLLAATLSGCGSDDPALPDLSPPRWPERIERPRRVAPADRPNLILISIDTLRADRLSAYGHDRATSPNLDRLARRSTLFEKAFSHSPKTAPSHMSLFTGLYPEAHRVKNRFNGRTPWKGQLSRDIPTLAEILAAAGYRTSARTSGGNVHGNLGFGRGFGSYRKAGRGADTVFHAAAAELEGLAPGPAPFFLFAHTYQVHAPYLPPNSYRDAFANPEYAGNIRSDLREFGSTDDFDDIYGEFWRRVDRSSPADRQHLRDLYDACIRFTDDELGKFLDRIEALGLAERTIVVVLSDHGEEFGEHDDFEHNGLWQEILHVPLLIHIPEAVGAGWRGRRIEGPVGLVDVMPTLLDLLGLPLPLHLQGQSLRPVVEAGASSRPWVFAQYRLDEELAVRAGDWKLLRDREGDRLFDLGADPGERSGRAAADPVLATLTEHADRVLRASRAYWTMAREAKGSEIDAESRRQLRALGYLQDEGTDEP